MRRAIMGVVLLGASCGGQTCPPEVCLEVCAELASHAEGKNPEARALTPLEHAMLGDRLLDVRQGPRAPMSQAMLQICAQTPCPDGASTPLGSRLPKGTNFVSLHLVVPKVGSWVVRYTRTCDPGRDAPLPAWAAPVERALDLRGDVTGAPTINLVDRFDVPAGAREIPCRLEVSDASPEGAGLLMGLDVLAGG